jgi:hypothetical protein
MTELEIKVRKKVRRERRKAFIKRHIVNNVIYALMFTGCLVAGQGFPMFTLFVLVPICLGIHDEMSKQYDSFKYFCFSSFFYNRVVSFYVFLFIASTLLEIVKRMGFF